MLGKLLKHEFRATARFMWVIYGVMVLLSFGGYAGLHMVDVADNAYLASLSRVLLILWGMSMVVGVCMAVVLLAQRFYKNLLTDEGYLMFTLPVSVHELVISKMLVAAVWLLATFVVVVLCALIGTFQSDYLTYQVDINYSHTVVRLILVAFLGACTVALEVYSAMSIGHGFVNHKMLWSVAAFFGIQIILQFLGSFVLTGIIRSNFLVWLNHLEIFQTEIGAVNLSILIAGVIEVVCGAIFYGITVWNLKKRLNLA